MKIAYLIVVNLYLLAVKASEISESQTKTPQASGRTESLVHDVIDDVITNHVSREEGNTREKKSIVKRDAISRRFSSLEIFIIASREIEFIDRFKEEYAQDFISRSWNEADALFPRGCLNDAYLPPSRLLPFALLPYMEELPRSYGLMQHCLVSLENLILDQIRVREHKFIRQLNDIFRSVEQILDYLKSYMEINTCVVDDAKTRSLTSMVYEDADFVDRRKRAFVILRDVRASFEYLKETYNPIP
ncbi:uncharacterized protein [Palaemon carinicauda]|uniref:uncharacterized protein n=1 Tax=Palaemon carinicauda TaxID=392227 RepID=UPI0035B62D44